MRSSSYVCFRCRRAVKSAAFAKPDWRNPKAHPAAAPAPRCPECAGAMMDVGHRFKAPRKNDRKQWEKVRRIVEAGFTFHDYGRMPQTLAEVEQFLKARTTSGPLHGSKEQSRRTRKAKLAKRLLGGPTFGPVTPNSSSLPRNVLLRLAKNRAKRSSAFQKPARKRK